MNTDNSRISLRPVIGDDREMIFRWRNDPFILVHGTSNREVNWAEHMKWFEETLAEQGRKVFVILQQEVPIGQVRFDRNDERAVVSAYLMREFTGRGWGVHAIREGCKAIFGAWDVEKIIACVRSDNPSGRSAFLKAGFQQAELGVCPANHYSMVLQRHEIT